MKDEEETVSGGGGGRERRRRRSELVLPFRPLFELWRMRVKLLMSVMRLCSQFLLSSVVRDSLLVFGIRHLVKGCQRVSKGVKGCQRVSKGSCYNCCCCALFGVQMELLFSFIGRKLEKQEEVRRRRRETPRSV
jgi:hypothetical protein